MEIVSESSDLFDFHASNAQTPCVEFHFTFGVPNDALTSAFAIVYFPTNPLRTYFIPRKFRCISRTRTTLQVRKSRVCQCEHFDMQ
jgi:hypothetical protein